MPYSQGYFSSAFLATEGAPFGEPVDWRSQGLDTYPEIVSRPMDLGTVKKGIEAGELSPDEAIADIRLVFDNCRRFNDEGTDLHKRAELCSQRFEERLAKMEPLLRDAAATTASARSTPWAPPLSHEKEWLAQSLLTMPMAGRSAVVAKLDARCPDALSRLEGSLDEIAIDLDLLDSRTFREVERLVQQELLGEERRGYNGGYGRGGGGGGGGDCSGRGSKGRLVARRGSGGEPSKHARLH
ncbi:unnamed protein product [Phaeothamnion confervicola]